MIQDEPRASYQGPIIIYSRGVGSEDFLLFIAGGWGRRIFVIYRRGVGSEDFCSVTIKLPDSPIMLYNILMIPSNWPLLGSLLSLASSLYSVGED